MSTSVGSAHLDLGVNYKSFNSQLKNIASNAETMVGSAFKKLGSLIAGAFATKKLIDFSKAAINLASDLDEVQNVVDVTFGDMAENVNQFAKSALYNFGMSELSAKRFTSTIGAMLKSSGLAGKEVYDMATNITALTGDMASFYNLEHEEAFNKIRSGLSGETEPLKQLGINMSVANMEAFALSQGIKKSYTEMSQAEQTLLRYNYLLSVTKDAQGDFIRTQNSWANQTKILQEQWRAFQSTVGQGFINILTPVLKMLNQLINRLQTAANYFKAFTEIIIGKKKETEATSKSITSLGNVASSTSKDVEKAGKKVKGSLAAFDELNVISQSTAENMENVAGGVGGIGTLDFGEAAVIEPEINTEGVERFVTILGQAKDMLDNIKQKLFETFGPIINNILADAFIQFALWKDSLMGVFSDLSALGQPLKDWFVNDLLPYWANSVQTMGNIFNGLLNSSRKVFDGIKEAAMPIFEWFIKNGLPLIISFCDGAREVFESLFFAIKSIFDTIWEKGVAPGLQLLSDMTIDVLNSIKSFWDNWGGQIVQGFKDVFTNIVDVFNLWWETTFGPLWQKILDVIRWLWDEHLKGLVDAVLNFIGKLIVGAQDIYNKFIQPVVNFFIKIFGPHISNAFQLVVDVLGTFIAVVVDVATGIVDAFSGVIDFIVGVFTLDWETAWNGIKEIFTGIIEAIIGVFKGFINIFIDGVNWVIRGLNRISIKVPDWVASLLGLPKDSKWGFNIAEIPKLAEGGLVSAPTLAMVGDNRNAQSDPEVVAPLSKLKEMLGVGNEEIVNVLYLILDAINNKDLTVEFDGDELAERLYPKFTKVHNRIGGSMIRMGDAFV